MTEHRTQRTAAFVSRHNWDALDSDRRHGDASIGTASIAREIGGGTVFVACQVVDDYPLFDLGITVATAGAMARLAESDVVTNLGCDSLIARHAGRDWGVLPIEDHEQNDLALEHGHRLFSAYDLYGTRYWVITEADRSATTIFLPEEY